MGAASLALNCVGGALTLRMCDMLERNGCMVTYGGMSRQPTQVGVENDLCCKDMTSAQQVSTGPLIFKNISLRGFWMSHWYTIVSDQNEFFKSRSRSRFLGPRFMILV
jgi:trans-2-enoyl-CoA reductase